MKMLKRILSVLLTAALVLTVTAVPAVAVDGTNLTVTLSKTTAEVGDTVTVTVGNREMNVISLVGGIAFDPTQVTCVAVEGKAALTDSRGSTVTATTTSTVETTAQFNAVGFAFAGTSQKTYVAGDILTATFQVIKAGNIGFTLYEDSDGRNGYFSDAAETTLLRVEGVDPSEALNGPNLALSGTAIADSVSTQYTEKDAFYANDGDASTRWQSDSPGDGGVNAWIGIQWSYSVIVEYLVINWEKARPTTDGYRVQVSDNGTVWRDTAFQVTRAGLEDEDHNIDTVYLPDFPETQYVRVLCEKAMQVESDTPGEVWVKEYPSVYEFEVYGISENLALIATADADSVHSSYGNGGHVPSHINDGDSSTRWQANSTGSEQDPSWASLTWETEQTLDRAVICWTSAHPTEDGLKLQISENGTDWTDAVFSATRAMSGNYATDTFEFVDRPSTKYLRVYCFTMDGEEGKTYSPAILEFEVYGDFNAKVSSDAPWEPGVAVAGDTYITLTKVTGYEYSMDGRTWQASPTFEGLEPETVYSFCQRKAATAEEAAGPTSGTVNAMTAPYSEPVALLPGDVNLDGDVTAADLTLLARYVGGIGELTEEAALSNAELSGDGVITSADLTVLARAVAGIL